MSEAFAYEQLPGVGFIRLFKLHDTAQAEAISGTLSIVPLSDETISYVALSYTWGSSYGSDEGDNKKYSVRCNGKDIAILENLHDALHQLCCMKMFGHIWVDCICIDQGNKSEKSQQVQLMTQIYSKADKVIIWLGQSDPESSEAIGLIRENMDIALHGLLWGNNSNFNDPALFSACNKATLNERQWKAILMLFRRRWFRRVWTLQEVALAKRSVALCGSEVFSIDYATTFATFLVNSGWTLRLFHLGKQMVHGTKNGFEEAATINLWLHCQRERLFEGCGPISLLLPPIVPQARQRALKLWLSALQHLVEVIRHREASDNRDKVLAPLTLALHFAPETVDTKVKGLIDYNKSEERIYLEFTAFMITCSESLDILSLVDGRKAAKPGQPSWVPDYSCTVPTSLIEGTRFNASKTIGDFDSASTQAHLSPTPRLHVHGIILGNISKLAEYWNKGNNVEPWCQIALSIPDSFCYRECREEILWRILIANRSGPFRPAPATLQKSFRDFLIAMLAEEFWLASKPDIDVDSFWNSKTAYKSFCRAEGLDEAREQVEALAYYLAQPTDVRNTALMSHDQHAMACQSILHSSWAYEKDWEQSGRRLFISSSGHVGNAPDATAEEDMICVLQGGRVPFIVRPTGYQNYRFVGEAYVHGVMDGEVAELNLLPTELVIE